MSTIVYVIAYLSIIVFLATVIWKMIDYIRKPPHVRWELYPVPHEKEKSAYGGSYLEDVDWWKKTKKHSAIGDFIADMPVMVPEILFLKAIWENNRKLWYVSYPFHLGLYLVAVFIVLVVCGSILQLLGITAESQSALFSVITTLTKIIGPVGFILIIAGGIGLFYKRLTDSKLNDYSAFSHFFNLTLFIITIAIALLTWLFADQNFNMWRTFMANLISFNMLSMSSPLFMVQVLLAFLLLAYIPLTHMSHFFMKYFLYHDIRWGDKPNINTPETDAKIRIVLNYPVTWAAPHIAGHGKTTWAEVATFNPAAKPEKE